MCGHSGIGFPYEKKYTISIHIMGKHQFFGGLGQSEPEIVLPNFTNEKKTSIRTGVHSNSTKVCGPTSFS